MTLILPILLLLMLVAVFAFIGGDGLWSNLIALFNVTMAGLLAMNFHEPIAQWLNGQLPRLTFALDYAALWGVFAVAMLVLRAASDVVSRTKVKFQKQVDQIGGYVVALLVGWVMLGLITTSLHMAPLAREFMWGGFRPEERMVFGTAPDRKWLAFAQRASLGSFSRGDGSQHTFDPQAEFMPKFASRREQFEKTESLMLPSAPGS